MQVYVSKNSQKHETAVSGFSRVFSENGNNIYKLLFQLTLSSDGYLDEAQTYRTSYGADFVGLVVSKATKTAEGPYILGLAYANPNFYNFLSYAVFSSVGIPFEGVFAHEIGHTMGCEHDRITALQTDPAFGHCWEDANNINKCGCYKSVMVYECNTSPNHCTSCSSKLFMANPNVYNSGNPTGLTNADCGLHIHQNRLIPISYRSSIISGGMVFSVSPSAVFYSTCSLVNITGWQLVRDLTDVPSVLISGIPAKVISFNINSVKVQTQIADVPMAAAYIIITGSKSQRITYFAGLKLLQPSQIVYNYSFGDSSNRWSNVGVGLWEESYDFNTGQRFLITNRLTAVSAILQYTAASASPQTGSCSEAPLSISFSYRAYIHLQQQSQILRTIHCPGADVWILDMDNFDFEVNAGICNKQSLYSCLGGDSTECATYNTESGKYSRLSLHPRCVHNKLGGEVDLLLQSRHILRTQCCSDCYPNSC